MKKNNYLIILLMVFSITAFAQTGYKITYQRIENQKLDTTSTHRVVLSNKQFLVCETKVDYTQLIETVAKEKEYIDFSNELYYKRADLKDQIFSIRDTLSSNKDFTFTDTTKTILGYTCYHAYKVLFSNKIEFWYTKTIKTGATPYPSLGFLDGTVLEVIINGNYGYQAVKAEESNQLIQLPQNWGEILTSHEFREKLASSHITKVDIFNNVQINFSHDKLASPDKSNVYHYAKGTIAVKKITLPNLNSHTIYGVLKEQSLGDAYDRTGSIFIIPTHKKQSFLDALQDSIEVLPHIVAAGKEYPGVVCTKNYVPPLELIRFFTPFGVGHFNDKRTLKDKTWEKSVTYEQDLTEVLKSYAGKEVWIGAYIANYDKGGHQISFHLDYHPNERKKLVEKEQKYIAMSVFNTLNILEMAGQPYATMFEKDSLTVTFEITEEIEDPVLRFITTGHGGWGGGDEFNQKENRIYLDNQLIYSVTPWREDCSDFRKYNPASGNFWNGISSSDLSRSGWCPGSLSNPFYIPLRNLKKGKHTFSIAIPTGKSEGNYFSSWNVSGVILGKEK